MQKRTNCTLICMLASFTAVILFAVAGIVLNQFGDHFMTLLRISSADKNGFAVSTASDNTVYIANTKIVDVVGSAEQCEMDFMVKDGRWYFFDEDRSFSYAVSKERDRLIEENSTVAFDAGNAADYEIKTTKYTCKIVEKQSQTVVCSLWRESVRNLLSTVLQVLFCAAIGATAIFSCLCYLLPRYNRRRRKSSE